MLRKPLGLALLLMPYILSGQQEPVHTGVGVAHLEPGRGFVFRSGVPYANYGQEDYRIPETSFYSRRNYYGPFGNFLINGYDLYEWRETRANTRLTDAPNSNISTSRMELFKRTVVASESQKGWATAFIIGDEIRSFFTPLTLNLTGLNGWRLETQTNHTAFSVMGSRLTAVGGGTGSRRNAPIIAGAHGKVRMGAMSLGATWVNAHLFDSEQSEFSLRGGLESGQVLPSFLIVRFSDDSPEDEVGGAHISEVRLRVNGQVRPDLRPVFVRLNAKNPTAVGVNNRLTGQFLRTAYADGGTKYADYFYLQRHLQGENVRNVNLPDLLRFIEIVPERAGLQADGDWVIQAIFDLREETYVREVAVEALVGNDYRVDVLGLYESDTRQRAEESRWKIGGVEAVMRAEDNVQDLSNLEWIELDVGAWTGRSIVSVDGSWRAGNVHVRWEYARSVDFREYPDGQPRQRQQKEIGGVRRWGGAKHQTTDAAYYLTAEWSSGRVAAGGELFSLGPQFNRGIRRPIRDALGVSVGEVEAPLDGFVEDNDDHDRWPDRGPGEFRSGHFGDLSADPDGVFPGNDKDHDGIPDTNRNQNDLPDYEEPFLLYDVEPDVYDYSRDWNHNGVSDHREDDQEPDFPYKVDQEGFHLFGRLHLPGGVALTLGHLDGHGIASGGRNESTYALLSWRQASTNWGSFRAETLIERVHDDIADDHRVFEEVLSRPPVGGGFAVRGTLGFLRVDVADRLEWRNSWERQHYLEGEWTRIPGLRLGGNVRYSVNHQLGGVLIEGRDLGKDEVGLFTLVTKAEYTWHPAEHWLFIAQGKGLVLRRNRESLPLALVDQWTFLPILKLRRQLTPRTELWIGMQGLPGLPLRVKDGADGFNSRKEEVRAIQLTNRSPYFGYDISINLGIRVTRRTFDNVAREIENVRETAAFMRVLMGFAE